MGKKGKTKEEVESTVRAQDLLKLESKKEKARREALELTEAMAKIDPDLGAQYGSMSNAIFSTVNDVVVTDEELAAIKEQNWDSWTDEDLARLVLILNRYMDTSGDGAGSKLLLPNILFTEIESAARLGQIAPFPTKLTQEFIDWACATYVWFDKQWKHLLMREEYNIAEKCLCKAINEGAGKLYLSTKFGWSEKSEKIVKAAVSTDNGILNIDPLETKEKEE